MTPSQTFIVQILSTMAILVPAVLGAIKAWRSSGNTESLKVSTEQQNIRLERLEAWQAQQDAKLAAIQSDSARGFKEAGQHRAAVDKELALLHSHVETTQRRVERIPTGSQAGYRRTNPLDDPMEKTPVDPPAALPPVHHKGHK